MIVVSNSSPLIALARISRLSMLPALFNRSVIPPEVQAEVVVHGESVGVRALTEAAWLDTRPMTRHRY